MHSSSTQNPDPLLLETLKHPASAVKALSTRGPPKAIKEAVCELGALLWRICQASTSPKEPCLSCSTSCTLAFASVAGSRLQDSRCRVHAWVCGFRALGCGAHKRAREREREKERERESETLRDRVRTCLSGRIDGWMYGSMDAWMY